MSMAVPPIRYAIYTRHSTEQMDAFTSCASQKVICQDFIKATGESDLVWCGEDFDDNGYSGSNMDRPGMRRLCERIRSGSVQRVYAVALDRLTRNMRDAVVLLEEFDQLNIDLRLVHQIELTSGAQTRLITHVLAAFAQFEREMIASRIADSRIYLKKHGRRLAGLIPYGYDADPMTKQLIINNAEARRVRTMFRRAADGELPKRIAFICNKQYWRTKVYHSRRSDQTHGGGKWTARAITAVLNNPVYTGQFADGPNVRHGIHEAIIDQSLFDQVQQQLTSRRTTPEPREHRNGFLLRQKIVCPKCGRLLATYTGCPKKTKLGRVITRYYRCRSTAGGRSACKGIEYTAGAFEMYVCNLLDSNETWQDLLGPIATSEQIVTAIEAWHASSPGARAQIISKIITKIEIDHRTGEVTVTFDPSIKTLFYDWNKEQQIV